MVTLLTLLYTFEGGMAAVIWTDVVQLVIYVAGTLVGLFTIVHLVPGGWNTIHATAASADKFRVFDFTPDFYRTYTFWSGVIGGAFLTTASHGTDQLIVQRLLSAKNEAQSKLALLCSGVAVLFQFWLFLLIGAMLWVFYRLSPPRIPFDRTDRIFPTFIVSYMPHGVSGILIAAILAAAMSNLSAALNSLSSTTMIDFYLRRRPETSEARRLLLSRIADRRLGMSAICAGNPVASRRQSRRARTQHRVGRLRCAAGSISARCADPPRQRVWHHDRDGCRIRRQCLHLARERNPAMAATCHRSALQRAGLITANSLPLVRSHRQHHHLRGRV